MTSPLVAEILYEVIMISIIKKWLNNELNHTSLCSWKQSKSCICIIIQFYVEFKSSGCSDKHFEVWSIFIGQTCTNKEQLELANGNHSSTKQVLRNS